MSRSDAELKRLGDNIARIRRFLGYSEEYLGLRIGRDQRTVSRIEHGTDPGQLLTLIAEVLETDIDTLRHLEPRSFIRARVIPINDEQRLSQHERTGYQEHIADLRLQVERLVEENTQLKTLLRSSGGNPERYAV